MALRIVIGDDDDDHDHVCEHCINERFTWFEDNIKKLKFITATRSDGILFVDDRNKRGMAWCMKNLINAKKDF